MIGEIAFADDNIYTLNSLRKVLQCNRLTAEKYISRGNYKKTSKTYNGNTFDAWIIPEKEILRMKSNLSYMQSGNGVTSEISVNKVNSGVDNITDVNASATAEMLRNITELNGRITKLENDNRDLQKEIKDLTSENTVLIRDKATVESKMLLIEDKSKTIEGAYSEKVQEIKQLQTALKHRELAISVLSAITTIIVTILATLQVVNTLK